MLPELIKIGVSAIKIEGRQRSPMYTAQVTKSLRQALDAAAADPSRFKVNPSWNNALSKVSEGHQTTLGAYNRLVAGPYFIFLAKRSPAGILRFHAGYAVGYGLFG